MVQFAVRIYREEGGFRGTVDGCGAIKGRTLSEAVRNSRQLLLGILSGAFPDRSGIDPAGESLVVWFEIKLVRKRPPHPGLSSCEDQRDLGGLQQ